MIHLEGKMEDSAPEDIPTPTSPPSDPPQPSSSSSSSSSSQPTQPPAAPRPPKTLRERIFHTLPPYSGPYQVGFLELELPARHPRPFSPHIKRNGVYALKLDTVLFAVYYPADLDRQKQTKKTAAGSGDGEGEEEEEEEEGKPAPPPRRVPWLPRPRASTCKGYAKFFNVPHLPVTAYMALTSMFTKLPAYRNAALSARWPGDVKGMKEEEEKGEMKKREDEEESRSSSSNTLVEEEQEKGGDQPRKEGRQAAEEHAPPQFPVVVFSHGLGGSRTLYSTICGELASFGMVVVALEHRDGSGARTYVNRAGKSKDLDSQDVDRSGGEAPNEKKRKRPGHDKQAEETKPYYKIDYLFPKDNAQDTAPHNPNGVDKELRGAQIDMRLAEIEEAFYILNLINDGEGDQVRRENLRKGDNVGSSSVGLDGVDWHDWAGRLDLGCVTMMGHSFGGATTVQALRSEKLNWITQGVLLDPWGPATPDCTEQHAVHKPVLSIGSEAFMHWEDNFRCVEQVCDEAREAGTLAWLLTIRGSTHLSQTDFAVLYPNWMSLFMKTIVDPERATFLTVHSALEFLKLTLPARQTRFASAWVDEQLLSSSAGSEAKVSTDHRPDDKWLAARLKIPNEFSMRLRALLSWGASAAAPSAGTNQDVGDEIWCHQSPTRDSVERHLERKGRLSLSGSSVACH